MIETTTDWDQPFEDHDFRISVHGFFEGIEVSQELASDLGHCLARECLDLVEERGKDGPNSGFVDIFGQKVYEVFREKLNEKRAEELRSKQEMERKRGRLQLLDQLLAERREYEREFDQHWLPELERQLASDLRDPWDYVYHWLIEQQLQLDRLLELQENRYRDIDQEREEFEEEEHEQEKGMMLREVFSDSIEDAVPLIAEWMKDTIEAEGESLVFNALKGDVFVGRPMSGSPTMFHLLKKQKYRHSQFGLHNSRQARPFQQGSEGGRKRIRRRNRYFDIHARSRRVM